MDSFPELLNIKNKELFVEFNYNRVLKILRQKIYEHMLNSTNENDFFDLDIFSRKYLNDRTSIMEKMIKIIIKELEELGWNCKLSYNDTGLFIYSTEAPPPSCW